ncbi:MAG: DUF4194 domain-containing protein [Spirochaetia bacterium]|jgi:hypothetical protein|nr:DUF4194 domain-containing protein [Spirochaetia bacterium]
MNENDILSDSKSWGDLCVRLIKGPIFQDDTPDVFSKIVTWKNQIDAYLHVIGLTLVLDTTDDYAYLAQLEDEEGNVKGSLQRLMIRHPLSYEASLILVILREELDKMDAGEKHDFGAILKESQIAELVEPYYDQTMDRIRYKNIIASNLNILESMDLIKQIKRPTEGTLPLGQDREYLLRPLIRAKVSAQFMNDFKLRLEKRKEEEA